MPPERRGRRPRGTAPPVEPPKHQRLSHPFEAQALFSADAVEAIHADALRVLEELGLRILSPEAVTLFQRAGARVEGDMVRIGRDIVDAALASAPREIPLWAANPAHAQIYAPGTLLFGPGAGCPNVHDRLNGRRPGDRAAYEAAIRLAEATPQIHILAPMVEPQDVPNNTRHYAIMEAQLTLASKPLYINARGRGQVAESLEMIDRALSPPAGAVTAYAVINTNSPRLIDRPMADGLIDLARAGQLSIVTPFCLAGAMAPITLAGALTLQHAEALAGIALTQIAKPGAPVSYGGFGSNVDMKSGAPAFGTPEHLKLQIGTGQLARRLGLPWRSAAGSASNTTDMQAATETAMGLWGALMAEATLVVHAAGWLEGGLTFGFEKFVADCVALETLAELARTPESDPEAFDAIAAVPPAGHFFGAAHTMARYRSAFHPPLLSDFRPFGTWAEDGAVPSEARATALWQARIADAPPPAHGGDAAERLAPWIERRRAAGGMEPAGT